MMRTTLTLDDDVAAILERLRKSRGASLKDLVNEALRLGLKDMTSRTKRRERLQTRSVALGRLRIASLDKAEKGAGGTVVNVIAYKGDYIAAQDELRVIDATARNKKCKTPENWSSTSAIR